jgi:hypothetical protein
MGAIYHRHGGGNHPHVHQHRHVHRHEDHRELHDRSDAHAKSGHQLSHDDHHILASVHHAYDLNGRRPAIVISDPHELAHWHFDDAFEGIALGASDNLTEEIADCAVARISDDLVCPHLIPRAPPTII